VCIPNFTRFSDLKLQYLFLGTIKKDNYAEYRFFNHLKISYDTRKNNLIIALRFTHFYCALLPTNIQKTPKSFNKQQTHHLFSRLPS